MIRTPTSTIAWLFRLVTLVVGMIVWLSIIFTNSLDSLHFVVNESFGKDMLLGGMFHALYIVCIATMYAMALALIAVYGGLVLDRYLSYSSFKELFNDYRVQNKKEVKAATKSLGVLEDAQLIGGGFWGNDKVVLKTSTGVFTCFGSKANFNKGDSVFKVGGHIKVKFSDGREDFLRIVD